MPPSSAAAPRPQAPAIPAGLAREQLLELYYLLRLTRSLEERLTNLYRQGKVIGGLFRSLGQEADAVGSAYALDRDKGDFLAPLTRNLGSMLVQGAEPLQIIRQYMAKATSPSGGREMNIHFGSIEKGYIGQISHLGDMVPVMAGVCLSFRIRKEPRVGLVYVGDGATSTGTFHEGINFATVQRLPLVCIMENNGFAYSTPLHKQTAVKRLVDKAAGYGAHADSADGNDLLAVYEVTQRAIERARAGGGVTMIELTTYRRKGHAEHDNQGYVPKEELALWEAKDPVDRYERRLDETGWVSAGEREAVRARIERELDDAVAAAEHDSFPEPETAIADLYASPAAQEPLWYRAGTAPGSRLTPHG
ncbi:MAG: thiamine pyrophosphate-dependent dehydrogenase E1 component subunit alpha [Gemmatimonadetes bacterium]|nr:thiamine pyrophosphate-dependent dehydrogenase E1 component subunit alpha [Gemmatimonadota bacterium]